MIHYTNTNEYCRRRFGKKLYRLSIDGGMTCPNRDGTLGTGGCIFCGDGSGAFAEKGTDITRQLQNAVHRVAQKHPDGYIAYFQSYTNTYAPVCYLRKIFTEAMAFPGVEVLSVATRPDCLPDEVISLLSELNGIKPVWVELGLQTSKEESIRYIRRRYENDIYTDAVRRLRAVGIHVITHIILFLTGESYEDMRSTLQFALDAGTDGVKLQLLHVIRGTDLEKDFLAGKFVSPTMEEYIGTVIRLLRILPENVVVHRLTGDGDKKTLISPLWSADKKRVLNALTRALRD